MITVNWQRYKWAYAPMLILALCLSTWCLALGFLNHQRSEVDELTREWARASSILMRAAAIETDHATITNNYATLLTVTDSSTQMSELDTLAKGAGVQVDMVKPSGHGGVELSCRGSWKQTAAFLQAAEGMGHLFDFPSTSITRREPSGEIILLVKASRKSIAK